MALVEQLDPGPIPVSAACDALGLSRASLYRGRKPRTAAAPSERVRAPNPRRLDDAERQHVLDTLHLPEFADQPPHHLRSAGNALDFPS